MKKILLTFFIFACIVIACKKSSSNPNQPTTCTLSSSTLVGSWYFKAATYKLTSSSTSTNIYNGNEFDACELDDYTTFNSNGTYNYVDAGISCSPSGTLNGTWTLSNDTIYTNNGGGSVANLVSKFSCDSLNITYYDWDTQGDQATLTYIKK